MAKYSDEARKLWPYLLKYVEKVAISTSSAASLPSAGSVFVHPLSGAGSPHTGVVSNAQIPTALLANGIRQLTGDLSVTAGVTIDGIDISAHAANPTAHQALASAGNTSISVTGQAISVALAATSGLQISSGMMLADTIAGSGLSIASKILAVNVGDGTAILSDAVVVDLATNSGLLFSSGDLALGTPTTLSVSSTNVVATTTHNHAVTASSDVGTVPAAALLKSTAMGGLILSSLGTIGAADIGQGLTAGNNTIRMIYHTHDYPHTHMVVNPTALWNLDEQFGLDVDDNLLVRGWIVGKHAIQIDGAAMLVHFDGPPPVETNFVGNATGHMGQPGVVNGGAIYREGKFGKAISTGEATTNLVTNPSFEVDTTGWAIVGTGVFARNSTRSRTGIACALVQTGVGSGGIRYPVTLAVSTTYTLSLDFYTLYSATDTIWIQIYNVTSGANLSQYAWIPAKLGWNRKDLTFTTTATHTSYEIRLYSTDNISFYVDSVQIEQKAYATPYCDGALGQGNTWAGTAHGSTSSRTAGYVSYVDEALDTALVGPMTVMAWVKPASNGSFQVIVSKTASGGVGGWEIDNSSGTLYASLRTPTVNLSGGSLVLEEWNFITLTYDRVTAIFYLNGVQTGSAAATQTLLTTSDFWVGARPGGLYFNGLIDEVSLVNRAMTADEIRAIYESNAPVFAETSTWHWRAGRNRIYADAEGLWGVGASGGAILGLYAGDDNNPAATKSWGGANLSEGDLLIGRYGVSNGGWLLFDQNLISGLPALSWGYADKEVIRFDSGGASLYGVLDIDTAGGIYQGTGTFTTPTIGLKIWNDGGTGRIAGYNAGVAQWYANTDGKLYAGAGNVVMDAAGIVITGGATNSAVNGMSSTNTLLWKISGTAFAGISAENDSGFLTSRLVLTAKESGVSGDSEIYLQALSTTAPTFSTTFRMSNNGNIDVTVNPGLGFTITGGLKVLQTSTTAAVPTLTLNQLDLSEELIQFNGTVAAGNPIDTAAVGAVYGKVRVSVNGVFKYLQLYN